MRAVVVVLALCLMPAPVKADWWEAGIIGASAADLATTEYGLSLGGRELNPLLQDQTTRIIVKMAATGALVFVYRKLRARDKGLSRLFAGAIILTWTAVAIWNSNQIRIQRGAP